MYHDELMDDKERRVFTQPTPIARTPVEDTIRIVVQMKGEDKHPDDATPEEPQWFKAHLYWGHPGAHGRIEALAGSPEKAVDMAMQVWRRNHG